MSLVCWSAGRARRWVGLAAAIVSALTATSVAAQSRITAPVDSLLPVTVRVGQTAPIARELTVTLEGATRPVAWRAVVRGATAAGFKAYAQPATDSLRPNQPLTLITEWRGTGLTPGQSQDTLVVEADGVAPLRLVYGATVLAGDSLQVLLTPSPLEPVRRYARDSLLRPVRVFANDAAVVLSWPVRGVGPTGGAVPIAGLRVRAVGAADSLPAPWIAASLDRTVTPAVLRVRIDAPADAALGSVVQGAVLLEADSTQGTLPSRLRIPLPILVRAPRAVLRVTPGSLEAVVSPADTVVRWAVGVDGVGPTGAGRFARLRLRVLEGERAPWLRASWESGRDTAGAPAQGRLEAFPGALPRDGRAVEARVEVTDEEATAPAILTVRLRLGDAPRLGTVPGTLGMRGDTVAVTLGAVRDTVVRLPLVNLTAGADGQGAGAIGDLRVEVAPGTLNGGPPPQWVRAALSATRTPAELRLTVDARKLTGADTAREVWARITVHSGGAGVAPWTVFLRVDPRVPPPLDGEAVPLARRRWATTPGQRVAPDTVTLPLGGAWQARVLETPSWLAVQVIDSGRRLVVRPTLEPLGPGVRAQMVELRQAGAMAPLQLVFTSRILAPPTATEVLTTWRQGSRDPNLPLSDLAHWLDWRGNANGRLDLGDVAAHLGRQP